MEHIKKGNFFGSHHRVIHFDHIAITETTYTYNWVDWHYHRNAYFTYLLDGYLYEENKKESYVLKPGSLLFHNWQDAHCNEKKSTHSRGFHIEIEKSWFDKYDISHATAEGSTLLVHPLIKEIFDHIYFETKINDSLSELSIDSLLLNLFKKMETHKTLIHPTKPEWVCKLHHILHDEITKKHSLLSLSKRLSIHPAHLSRAFPSYFHTTFGNFIRKLKINEAATALKKKSNNITDIAYEFGFADQSHFTRCFKNCYGITPFQYQKKVTTE